MRSVSIQRRIKCARQVRSEVHPHRETMREFCNTVGDFVKLRGTLRA